MKEYPAILLCLCIFLLYPSVALAGDADMSADSHIRRGDGYFLNNRYFPALDEYEQAVQKGAKNPGVFRKLSLTYYNLGFLDESVREMEKVVSLSPGSELARMDMGIAYLAKGRLEDAKEQFMAVAAKNPGFANAFYYLGEIFFRAKEYDTAWMFAKRSRCLGHKGNGLFVKLREVSGEPKADPCVYTGEDLYIRQILVDTRSRAEAVTGRIAEGALFEDVAEEEDRNRDLNAGGYLGKFSPSEIDPRVARALAGHKAFSAPVTVETESGFHIIQRIAPFHIDEWKRPLTDSARQKEKQKTAIDNIKPQPSVSANDGLNPLSANDKELYLVYAGSNRQEQNAIEDVRKLISLGYPAYRYAETTDSKGTLHIVVAGKYESLEKAKEAAEGIARHGFQYFIQKEN